MKRWIMFCLMGLSISTFGATATFTGASNNSLKANLNWDTGVAPVNQHVVFATTNWTTRNMVTTSTAGYLNVFSMTVNSNVNSVTSDAFQINGWQATSRIFSYNGVTVEADVTKDVLLSGYWGFNGNINKNPIFWNYSSKNLQINTLNFAAVNGMNTVSFKGDNQNPIYVTTVNQNWTCTTFLNNVDMLVDRPSFGTSSNAVGTGLLSLSNEAKLSLTNYGVLANSEIRIGDGSTFDVSGFATGVFTNSAVLQGTGVVIGDVYQTGQFRAGPGPGTFTFDGDLTLADPSWTQFEITDEANDLIVGGAEDTLTFEDGAALQFAFSGENVAEGDTFTLLSGFGSIVSEGTLNISVTGLPEGLEVDTSKLTTLGIINIGTPEIGSVAAGTAAAGEGLVLTWDATAGYTYVVESKSNLLDSVWVPCISNLYAEASGSMTATATVDQAECFYRVVGE